MKACIKWWLDTILIFRLMCDQLAASFRLVRFYAYNYCMTIVKNIGTIYRTNRSRYWRLQRLVFMSPAEVRFIQLMGGKVFTFDKLKSTNTGFPFTFVLSLGRVLKAEHFKREVRYGKYFVDFANDLDRIIEIDGRAYHRDVVADMDREIYIQELCRQFGSAARIMRIPAYRLYNAPSRVQSDVLKFLS